MTDSSKIKLMVFTPTLQCGGSEKYVSVLCNSIDAKRFSVSLVVLNNSNPFYQITNNAVEVIDLNLKRVLFSLPRIKAIIKKQQPDIVYTTANHLNLYLAIFKNFFSKKINFIAHESSIVSINNQRAKLPRLYNFLTKLFYKHIDHIVCQSLYMQQDLVNNYNIPKARTTVLYNPVDESRMHVTGEVSNGKDETYIFITVARLSEEKGIERLIHAVGLLSLSFRFYIIGEGDKRQQLQKLVNELELNDNIFFEGQKTEPFAGKENAHLFLMGSYYEGFPNALLEAGALGIPAIAFNVPGGIPEIIKQENGILVDDNDIIGFAVGIRTALSMKFDRNKIIEDSKKRFSMKVIMSATEGLFIKLFLDHQQRNGAS